MNGGRVTAASAQTAAEWAVLSTSYLYYITRKGTMQGQKSDFMHFSVISHTSSLREAEQLFAVETCKSVAHTHQPTKLIGRFTKVKCRGINLPIKWVGLLK